MGQSIFSAKSLMMFTSFLWREHYSLKIMKVKAKEAQGIGQAVGGIEVIRKEG